MLLISELEAVDLGTMAPDVHRCAGFRASNTACINVDGAGVDGAAGGEGGERGGGSSLGVYEEGTYERGEVRDSEVMPTDLRTWRNKEGHGNWGIFTLRPCLIASVCFPLD